MTYSKRKYHKALETLVYLAENENRHYWVLKAIYLADKEHLHKFGRQLFDDSYIAMKDGPVPSLAYDIVKCARGDGRYTFTDLEPKNAINVPDRFHIYPNRPFQSELLSQSEIECLDSALKIVKPLTFDQLKSLSHDEAYKSAQQDEEISTEKIIESLDNGKDILEYMQSK
ncbi:MAG TPA: hypothetical protein DIW44_13370 [Anaerolineaceae bacterium]|nr:hypothetical protein [Anaerolineaceae bacterium]